jgi:serine/threonine-protein kinase
MNFEPGSKIGDYEVLGQIGAGGMGRVYKVRNELSDRVEAMKVLLPDLEGHSDLANRFLREIKVQANLDHPNIAKLYTALRINNQLLMCMEMVEGVTLDEHLRQHPVAMVDAIDYTIQVLSALEYAHQRERARVCAPAWCRASRYQAREHDAHARRQDQAAGFRHCQSVG